MQGVRGEVQELAVRSTRLAVVPVWVGELTRLEALEVIGVEYEQNTLLKSLSASLGQLVALTHLLLPLRLRQHSCSSHHLWALLGGQLPHHLR